MTLNELIKILTSYHEHGYGDYIVASPQDSGYTSVSGVNVIEDVFVEGSDSDDTVNALVIYID